MSTASPPRAHRLRRHLWLYGVLPRYHYSALAAAFRTTTSSGTSDQWGHFLKLGSGRRPGVFSSVGVNDNHSTPNTKPLMVLSSSTLHFSCILWATLVGRTSLHNPITLETTAPHRIAAVLLNLDWEKKKKKEKEGIVLVSQSAHAYGVYVFARHAHQERQSRSRWKQQRSRRNQCFLAPQQPPFTPAVWSIYGICLSAKTLITTENRGPIHT